MMKPINKYAHFLFAFALAAAMFFGLVACAAQDEAVDDEAGLGETVDIQALDSSASPGEGTNLAYSVDPSKVTEATVSKVTDGDTIKVKIDGAEQKLRLIGVNKPESVSRILPVGTTVYLEKDVSDTDKYKRLLRYVWLKNPCEGNNADDINANMINAQLVADGWAMAKAYKPDTKYAKAFANIEAHQNSTFSSGKKARECCK